MFHRLLLTNDDGIDAPGLAALERACKDLAEEIIVVAPRHPASQISHRVTTDTPLALSEHGEDRRFAVHGAPADCVRVALKGLLEQNPPDFVISGINYGGNLGRHDFYISGTIAAAREAAFHGIPAAALSHYHRNDLPFCWETATARARRVIQSLREGDETSLGRGELWNINLPHLPAGAEEPELRSCELENAPLEVAFETEEAAGEDDPSIRRHFRYTGRYQSRPHDGASDVAVCFGGDIAMTRLRI